MLAVILIVSVYILPGRADEMAPLREDMYRLLETVDFTRNTGKFRADTSNEYPQWPTYKHRKGHLDLFYKHRAIPRDYLSLNISYPSSQDGYPDCGDSALGGRAGWVDSAGSTAPFRAEIHQASDVHLKCWLPYSTNLGWQISIECPDDPSPVLGDDRDMRKICAPLIRDMQAIVNARLGAGDALPEGDAMPFDTEVLLGIAAALAALGFGWPLTKFLLKQFLATRGTEGAMVSDVSPEIPTEPYEGYQDDSDYLRFRKKDLEKRKNDLRSYRRNFKRGDPGYSEDQIKMMQADIRLAENDIKTTTKSIRKQGGKPPDLRNITYTSDVYADTGGSREGALDLDEQFNNRDRIRNFLTRNPEYGHLHDRILKPNGEIDKKLLDKVKRIHTERMGNPLPDLNTVESETSGVAIFADAAMGSFKDVVTSSTREARMARMVLDALTGGYSEVVFTPSGEYYNMQKYLNDNHADFGADGDPSSSEMFDVGLKAWGRSVLSVGAGEVTSRGVGALTKYGANKATKFGKGLGKQIDKYYDYQIGKHVDNAIKNKNIARWADAPKSNPWGNSLANSKISTRGLGSNTLTHMKNAANANAAKALAQADKLGDQVHAIKEFGKFLDDNLLHFDGRKFQDQLGTDMFFADKGDILITKDLGLFTKVFGKGVHTGSYPTTDSILGNLTAQKYGSNITNLIWDGTWTG